VKTFFNILAHGFLWILTIVPYRWTVAIGHALGSIAPLFSKSRVKIVNANLKACFPNLTQEERDVLAKKHWRLLGRSFAERGRLWLGTAESINEFVTVYPEVDMNDGKPRLYVSMHMAGIEAGLIAITMHLKKIKAAPGITLYVFMRNDYFEPRIKKWRERFGAKMLLRESHGRELIREARKGTFVCLSPDMDLGRRDSEFVPFFGVSTNTVLSVSKMAKLAGAEVCPIFTTLRADQSGYDCHVGKPWPNFPSDDPVADTVRMSQYFEEVIKPRIPEYYWIHKRFKNRPEGEPSIY
jgi:Kdo2-lipid IVA lauroyltransferase/acyltransferase